MCVNIFMYILNIKNIICVLLIQYIIPKYFWKIYETLKPISIRLQVWVLAVDN